MAHIQIQQIIPAQPFAVYQYLTQPQNLKEELKGLIEVELMNPSVEVQPGAEFLYRMKRYGVEQPVRFSVEKYVTGISFTYHQVSGLFASWRHTMKFEEKDAKSTLVTDLVEYELPFGLLGRLVDDFVAQSEVKKILKHRLDNATVQLSTVINQKET